jgi:hypothetical protein
MKRLRATQVIPIERVEKLILLLRGEKVLLGQQLAELYGVPVKVLIQAVKRNLTRFPDDFMFQLSREEFDHLKSQFVTSSWGGLRRALPYAFTEQGVAMLSSVRDLAREFLAAHLTIDNSDRLWRMPKMLTKNVGA